MDEMKLILEMLGEIKEQIKGLKIDMDKMYDNAGADRETIARLDERLKVVEERPKDSRANWGIIIGVAGVLIALFSLLIKSGVKP